MKNASKNPKKIMVIGAGKLQAKTIKLVKELGYYCLCVDGNPMAEGFKFADEYRIIDVLDTEACLAYAKEKRIDGVTTTSATITLPAVARIAKELGLVGIDPEVVDVLRDKFKIKKKLSRGGLNTTGFFADISTPALLEKAKKCIQYPSIIKPSDGSGSKGVVVVNGPNDLEAAIEYAMAGSRTKSIYIEGFIKGIEYGVESFVYNEQIVVLGVIKQTFVKNTRNEIEYGHCIPSGLSVAVEEKIKQEAKRAIHCLGINHGSVNMDIILNENEVPYIVDLGARIGLNQIAEKLVPLSTGVDVLSNTIKASVGEDVSFYPLYSRPIASRLLILGSGTLNSIGDYSRIFIEEKILDIVLTVKPGDFIRPYKVKSDTCGWIITRGESVGEAEYLANKIRDEMVKFFEYKKEGNHADFNSKDIS